MTNNLKIEVLVSNIPEDGSIASQFPSQEYMNQQLAKKANLSPEGRLDPSHAPDYTEIPGLYEHIEDTKDEIGLSIANSLQDAKGYTNQQLSTSLQTKADLVNGKIPFDQIPFSADIEDQIQINVENITAVVDQKVAQVVGQVNQAATAANAYTDTKVAENKAYVDNTIGNVIEDVERFGVSKAVTIPTYLTPEAGVAAGTGVAAGAYFNVRSIEDDTTLKEYQNVGGNAVLTGKSYPSGSYVETISEHTALPFKQGKSYALHERVQLDSGDVVRSTIPDNINNPNIDKTGWFLVGSDKIKTVLTIDDMLSLNPVDQAVVRVLSYYTPNYALTKPYLGASEYVYKQSTVSKSDGFFNINGWNLIFSDTVDIYQVGFKGDYATDEGARLNSFLDAANKYVKSSNINKLILDGAHSYIMSSIPVTFDLCFVGARNLDIVSTSLATLSSYTPFVTLKTTDSWADVPVNIRKTFKPTWENVRVVRKQGTAIQEKSIGLMLTPNSVVSMYNLKLLGGKVSGFDYGVVFDENSYLIEFDNFEISGCNVLKSTTFSLDINTGSQTNMGENIRFLSCTFANAGKVFEFKKGTGLGLHYFASSFDYCGGTVATGGKRWFDLQAGAGELSFYGCHFESGNPNAGLLNNMFYNGYRWKVSIIGGEMLFSSTTYNNCQHFCYNAENGQISITGTRIFAPSVRYWANKGLRDFSPMFNFNNLGERYITENYSKSNALDPRMESSNIVDLVVCNGFTTDVNSSNQVVASRTGVNINGITYPALLLRKRGGRGTDDTANIYIPRDHRTKFISSGALKAYSPTNISDDVVSFNLYLVKARQLDSNGIPIALDTKRVAYGEWAPEPVIKEFSCKEITYAEDCIGYNWYKLSLRFFKYIGNGYFYILGLGFEEPDE